MISNHKDGGVLIWGIKNSNSKIIKCLIEGNSVGIHLVGEDNKLKIINNKILKNKKGVKVGLAC
jgi:parallel beta-helix repeat protein